MFVHFAVVAHPPLFVEHSFISMFHFISKKKLRKKKKGKGKKKYWKWNSSQEQKVPLQVTPFPEYPVLQAHVKLPIVLVHNAFAEHPPLFVEHSSISNEFIWD